MRPEVETLGHLFRDVRAYAIRYQSVNDIVDQVTAALG